MHRLQLCQRHCGLGQAVLLTCERISGWRGRSCNHRTTAEIETRSETHELKCWLHKGGFRCYEQDALCVREAWFPKSS